MAKKRPDKPEYPVPPEKFGRIMADVARADDLARAGDKRFQGRVIGDPQSQAPTGTEGLANVDAEEAARICGSLGEADAYAVGGNTRLWGLTIGQWPPIGGGKPNVAVTVNGEDSILTVENVPHPVGYECAIAFQAMIDAWPDRVAFSRILGPHPERKVEKWAAAVRNLIDTKQGGSRLR